MRNGKNIPFLRKKNSPDPTIAESQIAYARIPEGANGPGVQQFPQGKTIVPVCVHNHSKVEYVEFISGFGPPKRSGRDGVVSVVQFWRIEVGTPPQNRPVQQTDQRKRQTARRSRYGNANYY